MTTTIRITDIALLDAGGFEFVVEERVDGAVARDDDAVVGDVDVLLGGEADQIPLDPIEIDPFDWGIFGWVSTMDMVDAATARGKRVVDGTKGVVRMFRQTGDSLLGMRDGGIARVVGVAHDATATAQAVVHGVAWAVEPWRALVAPVGSVVVGVVSGAADATVITVKCGCSATVATVNLGCRATVATTVATVDAVLAVAKIFQRSDDDRFTLSADVVREMDETFVPDSTMSGAEITDENLHREFDMVEGQAPEADNEGGPIGEDGVVGKPEVRDPAAMRSGKFEGQVVGKRKRHKWCRGKLLLVSQAQTQFPQRLDGRNPELVSRQVYEYMLRQANKLEWSVQDKQDLPSLAVLAMTPGAGDREARKVMLSKARAELDWEYEVSGSRYPFAKRLFRKLSFWA